MRRTPPLPLSKRPLGVGFAGVALAGAISIAVVIVAIAGTVTAAPRDRRFFSARHGVGVDAPANWTISQHTGYPSILVLLLHPNGSRISVSAATTTAADARALADQNRHALEVQRLSISKVQASARGGVLIEARNTHGDELRQLYIVRALANGTRQALVVTLVSKTDTLVAATPGFDWVVGHLALEAPTGSEEPSPDAGTRSGSEPGARGGGSDAGARSASAPQRPAEPDHR